jgi:hypothetical protein
MEDEPMLNEAKLALRITTDAYDAEIASLLGAGARDLTAAGVVLPGTVSFVVTSEGVQDNSTLTDELCMRALITYTRMNFGSPDDYERLRSAYDDQKVTLMHAHNYTEYWGR